LYPGRDLRFSSSSSTSRRGSKASNERLSELEEAGVVAELAEHPLDLPEVLLHEAEVLLDLGVFLGQRLLDHV